jgi:uncharacterized membrane-anchored protein
MIICILVLMSINSVYAEEEDPLAQLNWQVGPTQGHIGDMATIHVPEGYVFLGANDTKVLMEMMENIPGENEYVFAPDGLAWFTIFQFDPVGYVKDDEELDPQELLDTVTLGTEQANVERRKRGWGTMSILGWKFQPRYDRQNNLLEWAFLANDDASNSMIINYNTRLLGRSGVMSVVLVADPENLDASVAEFKNTLSGYDFISGERYAEYREGDRVAEFGLAALIAGGAAAAAKNKGIWAAIVGFFVAAKKFIVVAALGLFAWIGSLFKRKE